MTSNFWENFFDFTPLEEHLDDKFHDSEDKLIRKRGQLRIMKSKLGYNLSSFSYTTRSLLDFCNQGCFGKIFNRLKLKYFLQVDFNPLNCDLKEGGSISPHVPSLMTGLLRFSPKINDWDIPQYDFGQVNGSFLMKFFEGFELR